MNEIICPKCENEIKPPDSWDFIDGESREIVCDCGAKLKVIIERPIEYFTEVIE